MIVPTFWAEARLQQTRGKGQRQITVRRFGWSNSSQLEAEKMAAQRAQEALKRIRTGDRLIRLEPKIAYNGATGTPIREEVLSRQADVVITRNSYGAHCLNSPNVLFADIDFDHGVGIKSVFLHTMVLVGLGALVAAWLRSSLAVFVAALIVIVFSYPFAVLTRKTLVALRGGPERLARMRVTSFVRRNPDWHLRLYRTPAGFRVLVMHRVFDPSDPVVDTFFQALGVDRIYAAMCKNQKCFRARVSPKPWRIGISAHIRPRPGIWPVNPEHLEKRNAWVREYEAVASKFASCKFIETQGSRAVDPQAKFVRGLHDELSQALADKEIA